MSERLHPQVFLSYARADDEAFVLKLCEDLKARHFEPWYDRQNMTADGAPFSQAIGDAVRASDRMLFVVGPRSVKSPYCEGEWRLALSLCKPVLPLVRLGDYDLIPPEIGKNHAVDCRESRSQREMLAEIVRLLSDPVRPLTPIAAAPRLPDGFVPRPQYLDPLKQSLRSGDPLIALTSKQEVAALVGIGGIGKTTLASALCHDCEVRRTFDQIFWIEAGPGRTDADAPGLMRAAAGGAPDDYDSPQAARASFARVLQGRKTLIVLDDVWDGGLAQAFLFAAEDCRLLLTTRQKRIVDNLGAKGQAVDKLADDEALALLRAYRAKLDDADARAVIRTLDGHALAVALAGRWLGKNPGKTGADLLARLEKRPDFRDLALDPTDKNLNLELALRLSYDDLDEAARQRFRALGVLAEGGSADLPALQALWDLPDTLDAEDALAALLDAGLLERGDDDRCRQHGLLRAYARALLDQAGELETLFNAYADFYTARAGAIFRDLQPEHWHEHAADLPDITALGDALHARTHGGAAGDLARALAFATNTTRYVFRRREARRQSWLEMGLNAARALRAAAPDDEALTRREALFLNDIGLAWSALGEKRKALDFYEQALPLIRAVGDRGGEATTLSNIGLAWDALGEKRVALDFYEQALPLYRAVGDRGGEATTLSNIGNIWTDLGEARKSFEYHEQALKLRREIGDKSVEANSLLSIGFAWSALGEKRKALDFYEQALPLLRAVGDRGGEATTLNNIGAVWSALGEPRKALDFYEQALPLRRAVGDRGGEATALNNIGGAWSALGEQRVALDFYEQALPLRRAVGDRGGEAATLNNIAFIYYSEGNLQGAVETLAQIIKITQDIGAVVDEAAYHMNIAVVLQKMGRIDEAIAHVEQGRAILVRYHLPQDAAGATLAQYDNFLAQLRGSEDGTPSQEEQAAEAMRLLAGLYAQGGADAVRQMLAGQVPDDVIEQLIALLANGGDTGDS